MIDFIQNPSAIQEKSFDIINNDQAFKEATADFSPDERVVLRRIIHTTVDFDFLKNVKIHKNAVRAGVEALKNGCDIITDVEMVRVGINRRKISSLGGNINCFIRDNDVAVDAVKEDTTRSIIAMRKAAVNGKGSIVAVGNAPTALLEAIRLVKSENFRPALIIGVPVGFVSAKESKDLLLDLEEVPYITAIGPKGGSSVAVAAVNALLELLG